MDLNRERGAKILEGKGDLDWWFGNVPSSSGVAFIPKKRRVFEVCPLKFPNRQLLTK